MRNVRKNIPQNIDGSRNIAERFANVYGDLYNSANDKCETVRILNEVNGCINYSSLSDVDLVSEDVVKKVIEEIKTSKNDPVFTFNSDCIKHASPVLSQHLANIIRRFLIQGHVSNILLISTIIPLLKDKLGDMESSENYRSIALSSVVLKIFDWVVISLLGKSFGLDELQFSYQKHCSTTMCTWLVVESISYFSRNNSDVYACFMDMKKAFDKVKHSVLFQKLVERRLSPIFMRLLIVMYMSQTARVKWEGTLSETFSITNGVKQGAVLSAILFCVYIDDLIKKLRKEKTGCWIDGNFVGIIVYADDIVLLSPSFDGLQQMIDTCSIYAKKHNLSFSTDDNPKKSKTKCMAFVKKKHNLNKLRVDDTELPWVKSVKHLGTTITDVLDNLNQDLLEKRADYISKNNELIQEFHFAHPKTKIKINQIFNTHFYGAPIWDMFSSHFGKLEKTWNVSHRIMLSLPRRTHKYFIEPITNKPHIIKSLRRRFLRFVKSISQSRKSVLRNVLNLIQCDCRSVTGRNLRNLRLMSNNDDVFNIDLDLEPYQIIIDSDQWRIPLVREIIELKSGNLSLTNFTNDELDTITENVCCT